MRLLAPYVGLTLETYTTIIGVVLGGIAAGSAGGGWLADRVDPRRLIAGLLMAGGVLAMLTVPLVRIFGEALNGTGTAGAVFVAAVAFVPPAAVLSAVTPVAAKVALRDLGESGTVVGRLSAFATAGALTGTFLTGFVLVPLLPVRATVIVIGALLVIAGALLATRSGATLSTLLTALLCAVVAGGAGAAAGTRCDVETAYFCARVDAATDRPGGRLLWLDDLRHSYVDVADETHLEFDYTRWLGDVLDGARPRDAVFVGGAGFSLPRYLRATQPASRSRVLELDPEIVDLARNRLGLRTDARLRVRTGDARITLRDERADSADVVIGDAFGGRAVPWHLTTREFLEDVARVLRPGGVYAMNVIDQRELAFARAETATLRDVFADVALAAAPGPAGGNLILVASDRPLADDVLPRSRGVATYRGAELDRFIDGAEVLRDDHAPADQLLAPRP